MRGYKDTSSRLLIESHHDLMLQEISRREILEYTEDTYGIDPMFEYNSDDIDEEKLVQPHTHNDIVSCYFHHRFRRRDRQPLAALNYRDEFTDLGTSVDNL
eukprot:scaffold146167_cov65-Attheya_sp.AAC.5